MVKLATVGTGWIVDMFLEAVKQADPEFVHTAVYSFREEEGQAFATKHGVEHVYTDLDELGKSDVDVIYIANPNALHYPTAKKMLEYGKHVLCEKTSVVISEQLEKLYQIAKEHQVLFLEAIKALYLPEAETIRNALKKLGRVHMAKFDFCRFSSKYPAFLQGERPNIFNPALAAGGLMDMGIYSVYPAVYFFGAPKEVKAQVNFMPTGADLAGTVLLGYPDVHVNICWSKGSTSGHDSIIQGDKGVLHMNTMEYFGDSYIEYTDGTREEIVSWTPGRNPMAGEARILYEMVSGINRHEDFYQEACARTRQVILLMERIREDAGITFAENCYQC